MIDNDHKQCLQYSTVQMHKLKLIDEDWYYASILRHGGRMGWYDDTIWIVITRLLLFPIPVCYSDWLCFFYWHCHCFWYFYIVQCKYFSIVVLFSLASCLWMVLLLSLLLKLWILQQKEKLPIMSQYWRNTNSNKIFL